LHEERTPPFCPRGAFMHLIRFPERTAIVSPYRWDDSGQWCIRLRSAETSQRVWLTECRNYACYSTRANV